MQISFLAGLTRSGGTLLSSILSQNPKIHTTGNSPLLPIMSNLKYSFLSIESIANRPDLPDLILNKIPEIVYQNIDKHVLDKHATWTLESNISIIKKFITKTPKFIVTYRPLVDVVKSFVYIRKINGWKDPEANLLDEQTNPIIIPLYALNTAMFGHKENCIFVEYDRLINNTDDVLEKIYEFMEWEPFKHDLNNIINKNKERDDLINLNGLHDIRNTISKRKINISLSKELFDRATELDLHTKYFKDNSNIFNLA